MRIVADDSVQALVTRLRVTRAGQVHRQDLVLVSHVVGNGAKEFFQDLILGNEANDEFIEDYDDLAVRANFSHK